MKAEGRRGKGESEGERQTDTDNEEITREMTGKKGMGITELAIS